MTLERFRGTQFRRRLAITSIAGSLGLLLMASLALSASKTGRMEVAMDPLPQPGMQPPMESQMQDMMIMMQNTAVWTSKGLMVLQGNRLMHYTTDLRLQHTVALPLPPASSAMAQDMTAPGEMPEHMSPEQLPAMRSRISARILPSTDGLIIVRGQQVIMFDNDFKITREVTLPDMPPLTSEELAAVLPMNHHMLPGDGMRMGSPGMPGMPMAGTASTPLGGPRANR